MTTAISAIPPLPSDGMSEDLLPRIPGEYIAQAKQTLPDAARAPDGALMDCYVNVPGIGRVRITARRLKHKRGRSTHYFWTAESAILAHESRQHLRTRGSRDDSLKTNCCR